MCSYYCSNYRFSVLNKTKKHDSNIHACSWYLVVFTWFWLVDISILYNSRLMVESYPMMRESCCSVPWMSPTKDRIPTPSLPTWHWSRARPTMSGSWVSTWLSKIGSDLSNTIFFSARLLMVIFTWFKP